MNVCLNSYYHSHKAQYGQYRNTNSTRPFFLAFLSLNHALGTRFITDDFAYFCSKIFFITILPFLLLHRGVQKWSIAKYCPHFSFITLLLPLQVTLPKKITTVYFVFNNIKMWIEMFFIKFEGKIENIRGIAENIFNFTQEFNEKH